jgi:DNA-binding NtrC family response regulator
VLGALLKDAGFDVSTAETEAAARTHLEQRATRLILVSQSLGTAVLRGLAAAVGGAHRRLVVVGAAARLQDAVDAMQAGAADFIAPPFAPDVILPRLKRILAESPPAAAARAQRDDRHGLSGASPAMARVYAAIARISRYKTNVLILGESGSGKELIARALHGTGPRRDHAFVPLNCATLGREILENELFGHERGAFTGANDRKKGLFELADGGTLFLDEIGELDLSTQAKLLRVIERNEFRRVGGTGKIKVDVCILAATNRDLEDAVRTKRFREDLYYRLKVVTLRVPALRDRREDIPELVDSFVDDFNRRNGGHITGVSREALQRLAEHHWPGNVRELRNAIESAAIMAAGDIIGAEDLESAHLATTQAREISGREGDLGTSSAISIPALATLSAAERIVIREHLRRSKTKAEAAKSLGIGLRTLYTKLREMGEMELARTTDRKGVGSQP